jgi:hypothetical protein
MKRIYPQILLIFLLVRHSIVWASSGDTIGKTTRFVPRFSPNGNTTMVKDPDGGYVFGTGIRAPFQDQNGAPLGVVTGVAQGYEVNEPVRITHIMAFIPVKRSISAEPTSKAVLAIHPIQNGKGVEGAGQTPVPGPGTALSSVDLNYADIQTGQGVYTVASLPAPVDIEDDFAISCMFTDFISKSDSIGLLTDANGDGLGMKYNWRMVSITNFWDKWFASSTWQLNLNVALFAVTENSIGLSGPEGLAVKASLFPNPAAGITNLEFSTSKMQSWTLTWLDASGRLLKQENLGLRHAGIHSIQTDFSTLSAGTYIYVLEAEDGSRIAHSFIISH